MGPISFGIRRLSVTGHSHPSKVCLSSEKGTPRGLLLPVNFNGGRRCPSSLVSELSRDPICADRDGG